MAKEKPAPTARVLLLELYLPLQHFLELFDDDQQTEIREQLHGGEGGLPEVDQLGEGVSVHLEVGRVSSTLEPERLCKGAAKMPGIFRAVAATSFEQGTRVKPPPEQVSFRFEPL